MKNLKDYDWYCDQCNEKLNDQPGFNFCEGCWECTNCGYINSISEDDIIDSEQYDDFINSGYDSYNNYMSDATYEDRISISDAVDIWLSHGKDEDYTCGYTEEELEEEANN